MPAILILLFFLNSIHPACQPVELGQVNWLRSLETAREKSKSENKPILILFQEVPGCSTCKNYGSNILSHPLLVEAIETYFIPLCIYNNKNGEDARVLQMFNEPSWNNPVVRMVDIELQDLVTRLSGNYSLYFLTSKIITTLIKRGIHPPEYLKQLEEEALAESSGIRCLYAQMYCFWSGEKNYARLPGIVSTRAGFMEGHEVVEIRYNPNRLTAEEIIHYGKNLKIADKIYSDDPLRLNDKITVSPVGEFRPDVENKYYLYHSDYKYIPMLSLQALQINSLLADHKPVDHLLSPRQLARLHEIAKLPEKNKHNMISKDMLHSWFH